MILSSEIDQSMPPTLQPAFEGQDFGPLLVKIGSDKRKPDLRLQLFSLDGGYVIIKPGADGILLSKDGIPVSETLLFHRNLVIPDLATLRAEAIDLAFEPLVVTDCGWYNYFHWLCLALPKIMLAGHIGGFGGRPVIPEYEGRREMGFPIAFDQTVWRQSLTMAGVEDDVVRLTPGFYSARRVHMMCLDHPETAFLPYLSDFDLAFETIRRKLRFDPALPKRILLARRAEERMTPDESAHLEALARRHGFFKIYLEGMDFLSQAQLFFNADAIIAAHGAGLSNLIFGRSTLRVLELNRLLYGEDHLRPWFYLIAAARHQTYFHLNGSRGEFQSPFLDGAIARLCSRLPAESPRAPWWRLDAAPG